MVAVISSSKLENAIFRSLGVEPLDKKYLNISPMGFCNIILSVGGVLSIEGVTEKLQN